MPSKPTPGPEGRFLGIGAIVCAALALPGLLVWVLGGTAWISKWWVIVWFLICLVPGAFYIEHLIRGVVLLALAHFRWYRKGIRGVMVFADSLNSRPYIEEMWLPRLADRVVTLNWSQRRIWTRTLPVLIFRRFGLAPCTDRQYNYCPVVIAFRGLRFPYIYRYYYAFRDAKHGNTEALQRLETHMFAQFKTDAIGRDPERC